MALKTIQRMPEGLEDGLEKMSPTEELAVEHGQLTRILLAMDKTLKAAGGSSRASLAPIQQACKMIRQSVVGHHMKIEEEEIYPQFEDTDLADFAADLKLQHDEARKLVARMDDLSKTGKVRDKSEMEELNKAFNDFKEMITAHAAWEETVLFPVMEGTWSKADLNDLREKQEEDEEKLLGKDAAEKQFNMLADLEKSCGISSVGDFTRRLK
jgi:hemerythrin-like domain-containing protein